MTVPIQDHWAPLNHKSIMRDDFTGSVPLPPTWVPKREQRRLNAYTVLGAYLNNNANVYVRASEEIRALRREYGDAMLLVSQVASAIIGRGARVSVAGADRPPEEPPEDASAQQKAEFERVRADYGNIVKRQEEIDEWLSAEEWALRLAKCEVDAMGLGDGVYWLTWSNEQERAVIRVLDPGFYFPVYGPRDDGRSYPRKVHLAWEYEDDTDPAHVRRFLRRITYELVRLADLGLPDRRYPYAADDDPPGRYTCLMSDLTWELDDINSRNGLYDLAPSAAFAEVNEEGVPIVDLDLGIDFIPIVHIPNSGDQPWGTAITTRVAQVIDDLQQADTDSADAATVAGGPPIAVAGATTSTTYESYGPRTVWELPSGGGATVLDTSKGLESLQEHSDRLFDRMTTNAQVPREILGKVAANEVPSGLALALSFGPFEVLIEKERQVRAFKYRLLLKMVQRLHIVGGAWETKRVYPAEVVFGSALPSDVNQLADILLKLTGNRQVLSRTSATRMLAEAGLGIPDVATELDRVQAEDFEGGNMLYRATRSPALAAEYLGMDLPEDVLMEQLSRVLGREVKLDEVRDLFDEAKAREEQAKIAEAEAQRAQADAERQRLARTSANEGTRDSVPPNQPRGGAGRPPAPRAGR